MVLELKRRQKNKKKKKPGKKDDNELDSSTDTDEELLNDNFVLRAEFKKMRDNSLDADKDRELKQL